MNPVNSSSARFCSAPNASRFLAKLVCCFLLAISLIASGGCSVSALKKSKSTDQLIQQFNLLAVRFSRPDFAVAELDDFSSSNRQLTCQTPHVLWQSLLEDSAAKPLIACINSIGRTKIETAHYLYVPKAMPYLEPNTAEKEGPACLYRLLPKLALPREVYFLAKASGKEGQQCYAMSFDSKANQLFDAELRAPRFEVDFHFPLLRKLQSSQDLEIWLLVSVLSLFEEEKPTGPALFQSPSSKNALPLIRFFKIKDREKFRAFFGLELPALFR